MGNIEPKDFIETNEKYGSGIAVNRYKNEVSIVMARQDKDGQIWMDWGYLKKSKNETSDKPIPWRLNLGLQEQAVQILEKLIYMIEGRATTKKDHEAVF